MSSTKRRRSSAVPPTSPPSPSSPPSRSSKLSLREYRADASKSIRTLRVFNNGRLSTRQPRKRSSTSPPSSLLHRFSSFFSPTHLLLSLRHFLTSLFLPINYPHSVTPDYLLFQIYDTIQATSSYLRGILCTQAILEGYGVGDASASAASATLTSMVRDGVSMLGGMVFAWYGASAFGVKVKRFRIFADVINDVGMTVELLSPLFPSHFLLLACVGSLCRTLCGIAAGATRAALMSHFALTRNISDISAKEGIQETAVSILGLIAGWRVVEGLKGDLRLTWATFCLLTVVHVWANVLAMRALILTSLTTQRAELCILPFVLTAEIPTPQVVAGKERIVPRVCGASPRVWLGARLDDGAENVKEAVLAYEEHREVTSGEGFMLVRERRKGGGVRVVLEKGVGGKGQLRGLFHGYLLWQWMQEGERDMRGLYEECYAEGGAMFDLFYSQLKEVGWKREELHLDAGPWRYHFNTH